MSLDISVFKKLNEDLSKVEKEDLIEIHKNYTGYLEWNDYISFEDWYKNNNLIEKYDFNITHNLTIMAKEAGIYEALWKPYKLIPYSNINNPEDKQEENTIVLAKNIYSVIKTGLIILKNNPEHYKQFDNVNKWGTYDDFIIFINEYLEVLKNNPEYVIKVWR
jgi:hypothetical protein